MSLHSLRILSLRQYLKKFLIREEEKSREASSLGLQVLRQALLDFVQQFIAVLELCLVFFTLDVVPHVLLSGEDLKGQFPVLVHLVKFQLFSSHLLLDIFRGENRFEVHPSSLGLDPVFKGILDEDDSCLSHVEPVDDGLDVRTGLHHQQGIEVIVKNLL
jgi:hypothetical protein